MNGENAGAASQIAEPGTDTEVTYAIRCYGTIRAPTSETRNEDSQPVVGLCR